MVEIAVIGCGNLGKSIIRSSIKSGWDKSKIKGTVKTIKKDTNKFIHSSSENANIAARSDYIFLCVKPFQIKEVLLTIKDRLRPKQVIISTAAGVPTSFIRKYLPKNQ